MLQRRLRTSLSFLLVVTFAFAAPATGQIWNEVGDAGDLVASAQTTIGTTSLTQINGSLSGPDDVDVYCFQAGPAVRIPGVPVAALQCVVNGGPQVWVFDANGVGLSTNSTCVGGTKLITADYLPIGSTTTLYIAVSYSGIEPVTATGTIWQPTGIGERAPDGTDPSGTLTGWSGTGNVQPTNPYTIVIGGSGVYTGFCEAPVPTSEANWGTLKGRYED